MPFFIHHFRLNCRYSLQISVRFGVISMRQAVMAFLQYCILLHNLLNSRTGVIDEPISLLDLFGCQFRQFVLEADVRGSQVRVLVHQFVITGNKSVS